MTNSNEKELTTTAAPTPVTDEDADKFDFSNFNFDSAGTNFTGTTQPKWKWSYNAESGLLIWPVDAVHGQPHHIELTGMQFYKNAQGRVYVDPDGFIEMLVWSDRGTHELQDRAINAVDNWLVEHVGKIADDVRFQTEGGVYQTLDPNNVDKNLLMSTYFGYPVTVKPDGTTEKA